MGSEVATWTIDTIRGSALKLVMSQPDAALYIQVPTFETTVALHITVKAAWPNGLHGDIAACAEDEIAGSVVASGASMASAAAAVSTDQRSRASTVSVGLQQRCRPYCVTQLSHRMQARL
jgi:hypothetical protein